MSRPADRLFGPVMFWTVLTGIFAWLPLVRILGRPEGYTWGVLGLSGAGTDGPFWIFVPLTVWVVAMLYTGFRGPRAVFHPLLLGWHGLVSAVVVTGVVSGGASATFQGQGLGFEVPLWVLAVPFVVFALLAAAWVVSDRRADSPTPRPSWSRENTVRLVGSLVLLAGALALFRAGTNYNLVTAAAILTTVGHWILLVRSLAHDGGAAGAGP